MNENTSKSSRQNIQHGSHTKRIGHFETSGTSGASATSRHGAHRNIAQTETSGTSDSSAHRANRPHRDIETSGTSHVGASGGIGASRQRTHKGRLRPLIDIGRCRPSRRLRSKHGSFTRSCSSPLSIIRRRWRITTSRTWSRRSAKCEAAGGAAKRLQRRRTPTQAPSEPRPGFPLSYVSARGVNLYSSYRKIKWGRRPNKPDSIPTSVSKRR